MKEKKDIKENKEKKKKKKKIQSYKGVFIGNARGFGFVVIEQDEENKGVKLNDIFIPADKINGAMNKDEVICKIINGSVLEKRAEGEIISIVKRGNDEIVGTYQAQKVCGFVACDDKKIKDDIYIALENSMGAKTGHKVVVKIIKSPENGKNAEGIVVQIIGKKGDPGVDVTSIVRGLNIKSEYDEGVIKEIAKIKDRILVKEIKARKDLRNLKTITIDGADTKDVDDAISLEMLEGGNFKLGVHIADVSHYVKEGAPLDIEAFARGTSVYLADRVIPMLPPKLSNGVCSLNAGVDRLALSCLMEVDKHGNVINHEMAQTVINVNSPINYNQVSEILTDENSPLREQFSEFLNLLEHMESLCKILRKKREKRGAIEFDFPEAKIVVDEFGKAIDVKIYDRNIATSMIEECMLLCNETVAEEYFWLGLPFVYRSHEEPDAEKMVAFTEFVRHLGYNLKGGGKTSGSLQTLLAKIEKTPEESVIGRVMLRSFKQAKYTSDNLGHFGLAAKYYCHFTSPIRRYPDLQIHRIIKEHLNGEDENHIEMLRNKIVAIAKQCSITERAAEMCAREVDSLKKAEYMQDKVTQTFDGVISGVTNWGIYVELANTVEGMVSYQNMQDDHYIYNKEFMCTVGERFKKRYSMGDKVTVVVQKVNLEERNIDFVFAKE